MSISVFVSYTSKDRDVYAVVIERLSRAGLDVIHEGRFGADVLAAMNEGLARASYLVLLWSQSVASSRPGQFVNLEWQAFLHMEGPILLLCLDDAQIVPVLLPKRRFRWPLGLEELVEFFEIERTRGPGGGALRTPDPNVAAAGPQNPLWSASPRELRLVALEVAGPQVHELLASLGVESTEAQPNQELILRLHDPAYPELRDDLAEALFRRWPERSVAALRSIIARDDGADVGK